MKRIAFFVAPLILAGCMSNSGVDQNDMTYETISDIETIGVRAKSIAAATRIDVYAICDADRREYHIDPTSEFRIAEERWTVKIDGSRSGGSDLQYDDEALFLASLKTLEIVGPMSILGGQPRIQAYNDQMLRIPELCRKKQMEELARITSIAEKSAKKDADLVAEVVGRTGVQPMLEGRNEKEFNNLVIMFRSSGVEDFVGKFVWAEDGDYFVSQILGGEVILTSLTNPSLFPPISILTDKQALEGQRWSSVSRGPLEFVGPKMYQTAFGVERQVLVFKSI